MRAAFRQRQNVADYLPDFFFGFDFADAALEADRLTVFAVGFLASCDFLRRRFRLQSGFLRDGPMRGLGGRRGFAASTQRISSARYEPPCWPCHALWRRRSLLRFTLGRARFAAAPSLLLSQLPCRGLGFIQLAFGDGLGHNFARAGFSAFLAASGLAAALPAAFSVPFAAADFAFPPAIPFCSASVSGALVSPAAARLKSPF